MSPQVLMKLAGMGKHWGVDESAVIPVNVCLTRGTHDREILLMEANTSEKSFENLIVADMTTNGWTTSNPNDFGHECAVDLVRRFALLNSAQSDMIEGRYLTCASANRQEFLAYTQSIGSRIERGGTCAEIFFACRCSFVLDMTEVPEVS